MSKRLDIIVWGASGYTGSWIAEYLARNYPPSQKKIKWAIAGRNLQKLDLIKSFIVGIDSSCKEVEILIADGQNPKELDQMISQTKVVCAAAGPFSHCGTPIVESCVRVGTHYCDITGEVQWVKKIIEQFDHPAKEKGVLLVPFCGFDSIPSDIGTFMVADHVKHKYNDSLKSVQVFFSDYFKTGGGLAGGTPRSALASIEDIPLSQLKESSDPNYLVNSGHPTFGESHSDFAFWKYNNSVKLYPAVHGMVVVNKKVVLRSASLLKYGSQFTYNEYMGVSSFFRSASISLILFLLVFILQIPFIRRLISKNLKEPGNGPVRESLKGKSFTTKIRAVTSKGRVVTGSLVAEMDPAYGETSKMVAESAITLALHADAILSSGVHGGVHTPSSAMGKYLLERLRNAKMDFKIDQ